MSLNDPRWGRKGSEDDSSQKENEIKEPPKETDEEPRKAEPSKNEMPGRFAQNNNDGDLEELWKQFNDRLNSMLGTKGNQNRNAQKEEPSASSQTQNQKNEDYDFDEPPLRKDHEFKNQQNSFGNGGGNGTLSRSLKFRLHSPAEWLFPPLLSLWPLGSLPVSTLFRKVRTAS